MASENTPQDLQVLKILRDKNALDGTAYFEFHPKILKSEYSVWNDGSIYLAESGFDFFSECFHKSNREFHSSGRCKYNGEEIDLLTSEIEDFMQAIKKQPTRTSLFSGHSGFTERAVWDHINEACIREALTSTGKGLIKFFKNAKNESGILWVLGM